MIIVGDVHGKINSFLKLLKKIPKKEIIQLGDLGFKEEHDWALKNHKKYNFKVLFGNHDYYPMLNEEHSLGNWGFNTLNDGRVVFWVRGANSIDLHHRTEGVDWFSNEELTYMEFHDIINHYEKIKPDVMITHDCPDIIVEELFKFNSFKSITSQGLGAMFSLHQPEQWIFGHHHKDVTKIINNCQFTCLNELNYIEL